MSDGSRFFSTSWQRNTGVVTRELGVIPGILPACDIFVQETDERGYVRFVIKNKSIPYTRDI